MKKLLLSSFLILFGYLSFAQITLLHTFSNSDGSPIDGTYYGSAMPCFEFVSELMGCYSFLNRQNNSIRFYNANFQLVKECILPASIFANGGHPEYVQIFGRHIVNTDDKIEFLATVYVEQPAVTPDELPIIDDFSYIINEDGDIIYECGSNPIYPHSVHKVGNQLRAYYSEGGGIVQIYSLGGNYNPSTMVTYTQPSSSLNPYPNPSRNTITLPYTLQSGETAQLRVFNMSGQLLETFNIGSDFDKIELNVSDYAKGTYIYTYKGVSKKFVVR